MKEEIGMDTKWYDCWEFIVIALAGVMGLLVIFYAPMPTDFGQIIIYTIVLSMSLVSIPMGIGCFIDLRMQVRSYDRCLKNMFNQNPCDFYDMKMIYGWTK